MRWFTIDWWGYLFSERHGDIGAIRTAICRAKGHRCGVWWYNLGGLEPDMRCKNCHDDLG